MMKARVFTDVEREYLAHQCRKAVYRTLADPAVSGYAKTMPEVDREVLAQQTGKRFARLLERLGVEHETDQADNYAANT